METLDTLIEKFSKIGYSIKGHDINTFLFDHNDKNTGFRVWGGRMEKNIGEPAKTNQMAVVLYFDRITATNLGENCVSICDSKAPSDYGFFVHFYNFDKLIK